MAHQHEHASEAARQAAHRERRRVWQRAKLTGLSKAVVANLVEQAQAYGTAVAVRRRLHCVPRATVREALRGRGCTVDGQARAGDRLVAAC